VTLAQLQSFATVARLGSVKAAARELGVSEPTISGAVAALRRDLGDELYVRDGAGGGVRLTPGGLRLAAAAAEILGLADQARRGVHEARGEQVTLRVAATAAVAELCAPALLDAFTRRNAGVEVRLQVAHERAMAALLAHRLADVALGPRLHGDAAPGIESVPFLRYALVVAAAPSHPLARRRAIAPSALASDRWLVGPGGADPATATGAFLARRRVAPSDVRVFPSQAAAGRAAQAGRGVAVGVAHALLDDLERGALVRLDVAGTPAPGLWHASLLAADRRAPAAWTLRRFVTTPEATQAMLARSAGVPAERFRPPVHVSLWS